MYFVFTVVSTQIINVIIVHAACNSMLKAVLRGMSKDVIFELHLVHLFCVKKGSSVSDTSCWKKNSEFFSALDLSPSTHGSIAKPLGFTWRDSKKPEAIIAWFICDKQAAQWDKLSIVGVR